jgi:RES domain-containing protein
MDPDDFRGELALWGHFCFGPSTNEDFMNLWRISDHRDLSGVGGLKRSGRWHNRGKSVVYLSDSPTGALLETLVHFDLDPEDIPEFYTRLKVTIPDDVAIAHLDPPSGEDWKFDEGLTRGVGDAWLATGNTCLARVPSAIATEAWNYLLNPEHPDATRVQIVGVTREQYDKRIFRFGPR